MTRVHLHQRWDRDGWDVFVYDRLPGKSLVAHANADGDLEFDQEVPEGQRHEPTRPTFFLRGDQLKALVEAAIEKLPADGNMAAHLKDAQTVRDRLLAMIEARGLR